MKQKGRWLLGAFVMLGLAALGLYLGFSNLEETRETTRPVTWSEGRVRVEVLNGGGVSGMARQATQALREAGFDVVEFGNASNFDPDRPSEVIDRVDRMDVAQAVAKALGIDNVQSDPNPNLYVDVSVLLGREWTEQQAVARTQTTRVRPWWDPRRWFGG